MDERKLLERITVDPRIFGSKPIIRGRRLAVEHVLGMPAAGDSFATILEGYPWLEKEDITAGHDVEWAGSWPQDPGDAEILAIDASGSRLGFPGRYPV